MKLSQEQIQSLEELRRSDAYRALKVLLDIQVQDAERAVLQLVIETPDDERALVARRRELEGVKKAVAGVTSFLNSLGGVTHQDRKKV